MDNKGSSRIGAIVIVAGIAGVALAFLFRGPGLGSGEGGVPGATTPAPTESVSEQVAEPETGFVVVIKGASYQREGRDLSLQELVAEAQAWTTDNEGAVRITQDPDDKALSGAVRDLTKALTDAGIAYSDEL